MALPLAADLFSRSWLRGAAQVPVGSGKYGHELRCKLRPVGVIGDTVNGLVDVLR
ncbi:hypothetical protein [Corynebacterium sputi]|uniref:hypothetical protein n=1 Tax=Corynebacterium sputi TaxID=489915 RepID=UPI0012EB336E|nr:hypothetical protein [Corynebacterium sputi]